MSMSRQSTIAAPYAIAFSIEELLLVRSWAERRSLRLVIATDQVLDGAEFEELLIIGPHNRQRRTITVWRTQASVFAQTPHGRPRAFATVKELLDNLRPAQQRQRAGWMRLLRLAA